MNHTPITPKNYNSRSREIPFLKMPKDLADTHGEMSMYLEFYGQDKEITDVVDLYLGKVNQIMSKPPACKPVVRTVYKDRIVPKTVYKDKIVEKVVEKPCTCDTPIKPKTKGFKEMIKNPFVIGGIVTGLIIGKIL